MKTNPAVSVILPVYNGGSYLYKAIESILNQSYNDFEFIIINDGSKDGSREVIDSYAAKDERIVVVHQDNAGLIETLNRGIAMAKAPLIARMDADDIALPERFADQIAYLQLHPEIALIGTSIRLIDEDDKPIRDILYPFHSADVTGSILRANPIAHPTVMMRKSVIDEMGGYDPLYKHAEDYELWLRITDKYPIANLPGIYLLYRQHPDKISFVHSRDQTLRTIVAQFASKLRREGKKDPVVGQKEITSATLELFDLTSRQRSQILFQTLEYSLNAHIFGKNETPVREIVDKAYEMAKNGKNNRLLSLVLQKAALFYVVNKRYFYAMKLVIRSFLLDPLAVFQTVFRLSRKIIKRVLKGLK